MKQKLSKTKFFFTGAVCLLLFLVVNPIVAKADELYFDKEGNLYFVAREKKATGSVSYKTIGWIIKRYDMPIDVKGQQYVVVTKTSYKPDEPDALDSRYVYSYFKSDKEEILGAVKSVSEEWYNILVNYGDTVYIDSVMTVQKSGEPLGKLYPGGGYEGEVYFTYEGISEAREWASKESIKKHFGMSVSFPIINIPKSSSVRTIKEEDVYISNAVGGSFINGSDTYDVEKGIPSGELMYLKGSVDKGKYILRCKKVTAELTTTVSVPVTYILKWTDYYGVNREETRKIYRNYQVTRQFSYYAFDSLEQYCLKEIILRGEPVGGDYYIELEGVEDKNILDGTIKYGDSACHIEGYSVGKCTNVETITVTGNNYLKPSIPEGDYSQVAESLVGDIEARSDKIVIGGIEVMSDKHGVKSGAAPEPTFYIEQVSVSDTDIRIPRNTENGLEYKLGGTLVYVNSQGSTYKQSINGLKTVTIHTPVVSQMTVKANKSLNQSVNPCDNDIVLGSKFIIYFDDYAPHRNIKGYGLRNYGAYVGTRDISCPFDVIYKGVRYHKGSWIKVTTDTVELTVCEDNAEGEYEILVRTCAYNCPEKLRNVNMQPKANLSVNSYGAVSSAKVRIIGKIYDLKADDGAGAIGADTLPLTDSENKKEYTINISTLGNIVEDDYIMVDYSYYMEDDRGNIIPVEVYKVAQRNQLVGEQLEPLQDADKWTADQYRQKGSGGVWTGMYTLPDEYIVVEQGTGIGKLKEAISQGKADEIIIDGGSLIIAVEFTRYKDNQPYISYINEKNGKKGYCNMWLEEGGGQNIPYGAIIRVGVAEADYYDYEVSGTH